ncbi:MULTISPECIES: DNA damage-inducible protein D [Gordonibacter]|uniref:DNA damage-inducible protein D n=1 Tax=Gordonibacter faecis TaxID=3047475 RepID=A0ABT7DNI1_9ACTN|nr:MULTISPECIES: DNA damage-inducible protein D [unclassified Gordonibacter]MDJ1651086.1 DNA damage-inducible protein D [Gordonibacter sp. KGMB12511]HIW75390.1 DNA damage-inducible protein D [Candidatus Gordonibacter avicola]
MEKTDIEKRRMTLDDLARIDEESGVEYWYARDIMGFLGYTKWQNFEAAVKKAMISAESSKTAGEHHFAGVSKMVELGSGSQRKVKDYKLTRYACYLIAQNGDPRKEEIAFAQSYFALQTRKQELIEERMAALSRIDIRERLSEAEKELSRNIYERGVDERGFARIRSKGDAALFGGNTTADMKKRLGVRETKPLADHLPAVTLAAKQLATEMTNHNVQEKDLQGEQPITEEHVDNNLGVRDLLGQRGIKPEELPPEEDVRKLQRRVASDERTLEKSSRGFPATESL